MPTDDGPEVATCVWPPQWVSEEVGALPVLVGPAGEEDVRRDEASRRRRAQARVAARRLAREHDLPMKVIGVDFVAATNAFTVYFTAENRVDFRALVRDLNRTLSARVQLRQLSARDSAKLQGGIGSCGRDLCCSTFLTDFEPVSVRMAKDQNLSLNPMRISGACGRLMCCLRYEHPLYEEFTAAVPALGARAITPDGDGYVVGHDVPRQQVAVALDDGGRSVCSRADVCGSRQAYEAAHRVPAGVPGDAGVPGGNDASGDAAVPGGGVIPADGAVSPDPASLDAPGQQAGRSPLHRCVSAAPAGDGPVPTSTVSTALASGTTPRAEPTTPDIASGPPADTLGGQSRRRRSRQRTGP